jgi:hypothetical protein
MAKFCHTFAEHISDKDKLLLTDHPANFTLHIMTETNCFRKFFKYTVTFRPVARKRLQNKQLYNSCFEVMTL